MHLECVNYKQARVARLISKKHICCSLFSCSVVSDSVTPRTVARQAPLSMGFSRQEYWSALPCPPPGDLPDPGIEPTSSPQTGGFFATESPGKPVCRHEHRTAQDLIPELLRLNCWPMWDTSWSDTNLPLPLLFRLQSCFVSLFTLIYDRSSEELVCQCKRHKRCGFDSWVGIPGGGNGNPLQSSCLENPMDRGAWQAIVHGVAKS